MGRLQRQILLLAAALLAAGSAAADARFPRPASLEPAVRLWTRVYTEVGTNGGLLHDSEEMGVVYEVLRFPEGLSGRAEERRIRAARERIEGILRTLAGGKRTGLSASERHVLALWPEGVSNATLRAAARRVRFQRGQADKMREGLVRSGRWLDHILETLRAEGVPLELAALPHVESSFNPTAHSHAGAAGLWQFTRGTGKIFMRVDHVVDERLDPFVSTRSAARLLRQNHEKLGTWPLALTAYNHGAGGMARAVRTVGSRDIGAIVRRYKGRAFGFASRNFYTSFLAALAVEKDPERYFGPLRREPPEATEEVELDHYYSVVSLVRHLGIEPDVLRRYNPALRPPVWSGDKRVPRGYRLRVPERSGRERLEVALARVPGPERHARQIRDRYHRIRRGETLSTIAARYGVRQRELMALNGLSNPHRIRAGQVLRLPFARGAAAKTDVDVPAVAGGQGTYVVRRGDTLSSIAARHGVSSHELAALNGLSNRHHIRAGQVLTVWGSPQAIARTYTVRPGDTLWSIARRFGVRVAELAAANDLSNRNILRPGQVLRIPSA